MGSLWVLMPRACSASPGRSRHTEVAESCPTVGMAESESSTRLRLRAQLARAPGGKQNARPVLF